MSERLSYFKASPKAINAMRAVEVAITQLTSQYAALVSATSLFLRP
jgi:hypothetical protein